ncbi:Bifunctional NAD(P)H-hydrate repair enzyme Nnr [compost metagenome]
MTEESLGDELGIDVARRREADGHKGTYGHVLLAAGSMPMSGAGLLAAKAALRAGCGLATWALPAAVLPHVLGAVPELMLAPAEDGGAGAWSEAAAAEVLRLLAARDVLAVGPGMGRFPGEDGFMRALWEGAGRPLVVDADALGIASRRNGPAHRGEHGRSAARSAWHRPPVRPSARLDACAEGGSHRCRGPGWSCFCQHDRPPGYGDRRIRRCADRHHRLTSCTRPGCCPGRCLRRIFARSGR